MPVIAFLPLCPSHEPQRYQPQCPARLGLSQAALSHSSKFQSSVQFKGSMFIRICRAALTWIANSWWLPRILPTRRLQKAGALREEVDRSSAWEPLHAPPAKPNAFQISHGPMDERSQQVCTPVLVFSDWGRPSYTLHTSRAKNTSHYCKEWSKRPATTKQLHS